MLIDKIQEHLNRKAEEERKRDDGSARVKDSFWCSECEAPLFDLYHKWIGTPPTNPSSAEGMMIMSTGKMVEMSLVDTLNDLDLIEFNPKEPQVRVDMKRLGVKITGYMDAVLKDGRTPVEVKSFYGDYQAKELKEGKARTSYLKQLGCYMDFIGSDIGRLVYINRGTGELLEFILERNGLKFKCLDIEFDLEDTYKRWAELYYNNILPRKEPISEFRYKIKVEDIDWSLISNADISKARTNKKVIGDSWQVAYSPYKSLIIEREGSTLGYTEEELEFILNATKGYSKRK